MLVNIYPNNSDRCVFIGGTGSGKTYTMLEICAQRYYGEKQIQILNTKSDSTINRLDAPNVTDIDELPRYKFPEYPVVIYTPCAEELIDFKCMDDWCQWIYNRTNTHAMIDETSQLSNGTKAGIGLTNLACRGRDRNVSAMFATQRPVGIPRIVASESQHFYKFWLGDEDDRASVAKKTSPAMSRQVKHVHGFHYYKAGTNKVFYFKSI